MASRALIATFSTARSSSAMSTLRHAGLVRCLALDCQRDVAAQRVGQQGARIGKMAGQVDRLGAEHAAAGEGQQLPRQRLAAVHRGVDHVEGADIAGLAWAAAQASTLPSTIISRLLKSCGHPAGEFAERLQPPARSAAPVRRRRGGLPRRTRRGCGSARPQRDQHRQRGGHADTRWMDSVSSHSWRVSAVSLPAATNSGRGRAAAGQPALAPVDAGEEGPACRGRRRRKRRRDGQPAGLANRLGQRRGSAPVPRHRVGRAPGRNRGCGRFRDRTCRNHRAAARR